MGCSMATGESRPTENLMDSMESYFCYNVRRQIPLRLFRPRSELSRSEMSTNHFIINTAFIAVRFWGDTHVFDADQAYRNILIYFVRQEGTCTTNHYSHRRSFIMYSLAFLMIGPFGLLLF
jgi:hypothetical protein